LSQYSGYTWELGVGVLETVCDVRVVLTTDVGNPKRGASSADLITIEKGETFVKSITPSFEMYWTETPVAFPAA
jgi:hypothetical protein